METSGNRREMGALDLPNAQIQSSREGGDLGEVVVLNRCILDFIIQESV